MLGGARRKSARPRRADYGCNELQVDEDAPAPSASPSDGCKLVRSEGLVSGTTDLTLGQRLFWAPVYSRGARWKVCAGGRPSVTDIYCPFSSFTVNPFSYPKKRESPVCPEPCGTGFGTHRPGREG